MVRGMAAMAMVHNVSKWYRPIKEYDEHTSEIEMSETDLTL
jgi:hypothetical protein